MTKTKGQLLVELRDSRFGNFFLDSFLINRQEIHECEKLITNFFSDKIEKFAVRSSSSNEDQEISNAGKFKTVLDVKKENLKWAINQVFHSYESEEISDHILVQPLLENVDFSGVLFTSDPNTGSPYKIINYSIGKDTNIITSGNSNGNLLVVIDENLPYSSDIPVKDLIKICKEITLHLGIEHADIEFAIIDQKIYILQVRFLQINKQTLSKEKFQEKLNSVCTKFDELNVRHPQLFGNKTILSNMADWNPAELIGVRPKPLALSLFKDLISDGIWAYERSNLGYRNLRSFPIAIELAGQPFIDTRVSFNSLIPENLDNKISEKLVNFYLDKLNANPELHDKVEFDILLTNYKEDFQAYLNQIPLESWEQNDFKFSIKELTKSIIKSNPYGLKQSIIKSSSLQNRFENIKNSELPLVSKIYWLLEDCKRYGTLPFAGIARCAFIATDILNSFKECEFISEQELEDFYRSIETIPSSLPYLVEKLSKEQFLNRFGHLRPGTFEIEQETYLENYDKYFANSARVVSTSKASADTLKIMATRIQNSGFIQELNLDTFELLDFCISSIRNRENVKFLFSQNISEALTLLSKLGDLNGINREDLSYLNVQDIYNSYRESSVIASELLESIEKGQQKFLETRSLWLPSVISSSSQVLGFEVLASQPNFVTQEIAKGNPIYLQKSAVDISGKIVFIDNADPGFDWIFSHKILGLVTAFGGANSHMAVRCKEMNIPAAIGIGEEQMKFLIKQNYLILDCQSKKIEVLT